MCEKGAQNCGAALGAWRIPAFCGLGLSVDAALFRAARLMPGLARVGLTAPRPSASDPVRPWGFGLLLTLGRQTRAG